MNHQILTLTLKKIREIWAIRDIPNISELNAAYLQQIICERKPKHILEIGTANGYSTISFVEALSRIDPDHATDITTIEQAWNMHNDAVTYFRNCKIKQIHAIWGDAKSVIPILRDGYFDLIFIDAMKREYLDYLQLCIPKMSLDAMIIIDDVIKFRDKMSNLYDFLDEKQIRYIVHKTDPDDGIMILYFHDLCNWKTLSSDVHSQ
jgi:predicted O-methyltransferase YrrM